MDDFFHGQPEPALERSGARVYLPAPSLPDGPEGHRLMNYFLRSLREAAKSWPLLAAAMLCSAGVAALWGANIAALFPIIEVTLKGESLHSWNEKRIVDAEARMEAARPERERLEGLIAGGTLAGKELGKVKNQLDTLKLNVSSDNAVAISARKLGPWLDWALPRDPFQTVLVVVLFVVVSTFVKHAFLLASTMMVAYVAMSISRSIRIKVFEKALALDRAQFMRHGSAGFMAQVTATSEMLANGIMAFYGGAITEPFKIMACLGCAMVVSWRLTLACLVLAPVVGFLMVWLNRRMRNVSQFVLSQSKGYHHVLLESLNNVLTVQAYTMEDFEKQRFRDCTGDMLRVGMHHRF